VLVSAAAIDSLAALRSYLNRFDPGRNALETTRSIFQTGWIAFSEDDGDPLKAQ
jgi:hypothetical protein